MTARKEAEEQLRHQAYHDHLTGLPNRTLFKQRVEDAITRSEQGVAVLILDVDDFKAVNDRFGHMDADAVLRDIGSRLRVALPPTVTVARIGGDEFAVLVESDDPGRDAAKAAQSVSDALRAPVQMAGVEIFVTASVGVAVGGDVDGLFRQADLAMYHAKATGKAQAVVYDRSLDDDLGERLSLLGELRRARIDREFVLHYQPVVDLETGDVVGAEALLRWQHPTRGIVAPGDFIPIAEESGLIVPLGRWVLARGVPAARPVESRGAVCPSAPDQRQRIGPPAAGRGLRRRRARCARGAGLEPRALVLEVTEASVVHDPARATRMLDALRAMGVGLVLDDFGTGYSSLAMLDALPFDGMKLDRSSVMRIGASGGAVPLVRAIVDLGRALGLSLVAEGIENEHQLAELRRLGVREGQGFRFARPLPATDFQLLLRHGSASGRAQARPPGTGRKVREQPPRGRLVPTHGGGPGARPKA